MPRIGWALLALLAGVAIGLAEDAPDSVDNDTVASSAEAEAAVEDDPPTICELIEAAAAAHALPVDFFTRLIWKESRFRPNAVSPKGAQGIAQFMPGTAARRALADPFDPIEAIPASAHYLRDLADQFGNLGLAAAAYNSGERRVEGWLAGNGGLPYETRDYVLSITGLTAEEWRPDPVGSAPAWPSPSEDCIDLAARLARPGAGTALVSRIERADWAPWGVQVAGNFSLDRAMAAYARVQRAHAALLGDRAPMVVRATNRSRGNAPFFNIRVPAATREEAGDVCRRLQSAGGACIVLRTGR